MQELSLDLAEGNYETNLFGHIPGSLNTWADALSRATDPNQQKNVPDELVDLPQATVAVRGPDWWRASTRPS